MSQKENKLTPDAVKTAVFDIIREQFNYEDAEVGEDTTPEILGMDSLDTVEIVMALEDKFNIEIPDEAIESLTNVGELVAYVQAQVINTQAN